MRERKWHLSGANLALDLEREPRHRRLVLCPTRDVEETPERVVFLDPH